MNDVDNELFTVVQFFPAGQYEYVCRNVGAKAAVDAAYLHAFRRRDGRPYLA